MLPEGSQSFDLTKTFFRERLFKGLRQNILKDNSWGSYIVLPFIENIPEESNDNELQKYLNNERFAIRNTFFFSNSRKNTKLLIPNYFYFTFSKISIKYMGTFKKNIMVNITIINNNIMKDLNYYVVIIDKG